MATLRNYAVFISHAWHRDEEYRRVETMLDEAANFRWRNLSVPEHDPVSADAGRSIEYYLRNHMRDACVFLLCAGMYVSHSEYIQFEIDFARRIGRPIIAIAPWNAARLPNGAQYAVETVSRSDSLVAAIRQHALPEDA
jgi:hypothetical protein